MTLNYAYTRIVQYQRLSCKTCDRILFNKTNIMYFTVDFSCNDRAKKYENSGERYLLFLSLFFGWILICIFPRRVCNSSWTQETQLMMASFHSYLATFYDFNNIWINSWTKFINYFINVHVYNVSVCSIAHVVGNSSIPHIVQTNILGLIRAVIWR